MKETWTHKAFPMNERDTTVDIDSLMEHVRHELVHKHEQGEPPGLGPTARMRLSVDEIMRRVRAEVVRRHRESTLADSCAPINGDDEVPPRWQPAAERLPVKREYVLPELLAFSDEDFIDTAYRAVLRRQPDKAEFQNYLSQLRTGTATKIEILAALRWSPEGVSRGVHVDGLLAPYLLHKWRRKRFIGPVIRWLHAFLRLGRISERQGVIESAQARESQQIGRRLNQVTEHLIRRVDTIQQQVAARPDISAFNALDVAQSAIRTRLAEMESTVGQLRSQLELQQQRQQQTGADANALDPLYAAFEDRFRGDRSLVRARAEPYVEWMREVGAGTAVAPVLDIGCGRGEWLELLRDQGLIGRGVDLNRVFLDACRGRGLDVIEGDAIDSLRAIPDGSVGAVTSMHLVEHLPFERVIALLDEIRRVLRSGGLVLLETPNPENLSVGVCNFYMDPTHRNPLPPEALRWIVEARGFMGARIERLTVARELNAPPLLPDDVPGAASVNVLLASLSVAPDYAIIARKD